MCMRVDAYKLNTACATNRRLLVKEMLQLATHLNILHNMTYLYLFHFMFLNITNRHIKWTIVWISLLLQIKEYIELTNPSGILIKWPCDHLDASSKA